MPAPPRDVLSGMSEVEDTGDVRLEYGAMMNSPEQFVLLVNAVILGFAYLVVYPRFAGRDRARLAINDLIANGCTLLVVGVSYTGTGQQFDLLFGEFGWFAFTLVTFLLMEIPLFLWYARRYRIFDREEDEQG